MMKKSRYSKRQRQADAVAAGTVSSTSSENNAIPSLKASSASGTGLDAGTSLAMATEGEPYFQPYLHSGTAALYHLLLPDQYHSRPPFPAALAGPGSHVVSANSGLPATSNLPSAVGPFTFTGGSLENFSSIPPAATASAPTPFVGNVGYGKVSSFRVPSASSPVTAGPAADTLAGYHGMFAGYYDQDMQGHHRRVSDSSVGTYSSSGASSGYSYESSYDRYRSTSPAMAGLWGGVVEEREDERLGGEPSQAQCEEELEGGLIWPMSPALRAFPRNRADQSKESEEIDSSLSENLASALVLKEDEGSQSSETYQGIDGGNIEDEGSQSSETYQGIDGGNIEDEETFLRKCLEAQAKLPILSTTYVERPIPPPLMLTDIPQYLFRVYDAYCVSKHHPTLGFLAGTTTIQFRPTPAVHPTASTLYAQPQVSCIPSTYQFTSLVDFRSMISAHATWSQRRILTPFISTTDSLARVKRDIRRRREVSGTLAGYRNPLYAVISTDILVRVYGIPVWKMDETMARLGLAGVVGRPEWYRREWICKDWIPAAAVIGWGLEGEMLTGYGF